MLLSIATMPSLLRDSSTFRYEEILVLNSLPLRLLCFNLRPHCHHLAVKQIVQTLLPTQINGGFGIDFSRLSDDPQDGVAKVAKGILSHGVTAFCPTLVTTTKEDYSAIVPKVRKPLEISAVLKWSKWNSPFYSNVFLDSANRRECQWRCCSRSAFGRPIYLSRQEGGSPPRMHAWSQGWEL